MLLNTTIYNNFETNVSKDCTVEISTEISSLEENKSKSTTDDDIFLSSEDDAGTFKQLYAEIESASTTLSLNKSYTYNADIDGDYIDGINITKAITIDGNGFTVDGANTARILYKIFTTFSSYGIIFNIDQYKDYQ